MARKSRGRKRKAKKNAKSVASKVASNPKGKNAPNRKTPEAKTVEADVVIAPAMEETEPLPAVRPEVHQAEVIEIRPADIPEPESPDDDLSLDEWDEPEFQGTPLSPSEHSPEHNEDSLGELDALQSELDAMLDDGTLANAPLIYDDHASAADEAPIKRGHRFERKLQPADRLLLGVIGEIPIIGRIFVRDGAWRPVTVFTVIFSLINALLFWLVLELMVEKDPLRGVNVATIPVEPAKSVPMDEIRACVRAFTVASTWEEKLKHVRGAGYVVEKLRDYYQTNPVRLGEDVIIERAERVEMNGLDLFKIEATILPQEKTLVLMMERDARSYLKVDWEVAVDYQEVPWQTFYDEQRTEPTNLRVVLRFQDPPYHNYQFGDPEKFRGYRLSYPDTDLPTLTGYVERGSDLDKELEGLLTSSVVGEHSAILTVAFPEQPRDPAMVRIIKVVSPGWVVDYESAAHTSE